MRAFRLVLSPALLAAVALVAGCGPPNQVNVELRRQNQKLQDRVHDLEQQHLLDVRVIQHAEEQHGTLQIYPADRLAKLYVARTLKFGRSTGGSDLGVPGPGDHGLKVEVVPIDQQGDPIKAAGTFEIKAFDLSKDKDNLVGEWHFDLKQSGDDWFSSLLLYTYILPCPWQTAPTHSQLTVRVTFFDELTQTNLPTVEKVVTITLPPRSDKNVPATQPATRTAP